MYLTFLTYNYYYYLLPHIHTTIMDTLISYRIVKSCMWWMAIGPSSYFIFLFVLLFLTFTSLSHLFIYSIIIFIVVCIHIRTTESTCVENVCLMIKNIYINLCWEQYVLCIHSSIYIYTLYTFWYLSFSLLISAYDLSGCVGFIKS